MRKTGSRRTTTLGLRKLRKWKGCPLTNGAREHIQCSEITSKIWLDWARVHIQGLWSSVGQTTWKSVGQRQSPYLDFIQDLLRRVLSWCRPLNGQPRWQMDSSHSQESSTTCASRTDVNIGQYPAQVLSDLRDFLSILKSIIRFINMGKLYKR